MKIFKNICTYFGAFILGVIISSVIKHMWLTNFGI